MTKKRKLLIAVTSLLGVGAAAATAFVFMGGKPQPVAEAAAAAEPVAVKPIPTDAAPLPVQPPPASYEAQFRARTTDTYTSPASYEEDAPSEAGNSSRFSGYDNATPVTNVSANGAAAHPFATAGSRLGTPDTGGASARFSDSPAEPEPPVPREFDAGAAQENRFSETAYGVSDAQDAAAQPNRFGATPIVNPYPAEGQSQENAPTTSVYDASAAAAATLRNETPAAQPAMIQQLPPAQAAPVINSYAPPASTQQASPVQETEGSGIPGDRSLEGTQAPTVSLVKTAPPEIQVGKPATFQLRVINIGKTEAANVVVYDEVPKGTRMLASTPNAERAQDGRLMWSLGALKPGEETNISVQLLPLSEGEIGSVATVSLAAKASVRTLCTKPQLVVTHSVPAKVLIGQPISMTITLSNPGTGAATGVVLEENVPEGLSHPAGRELEYEVGTLRPGETRELQLTLNTEQAGKIDHVLTVRGDGNLLAEDNVAIEVIAPQLQLSLEGPNRRYLERQATYTVQVANPGTASATNVELVAYLPKGLKFTATNKQGQYDPQSHAVYWSLAELPAGTNGDVQVTVLPLEIGEQKIRTESRADLSLEHSQEQVVTVEGLAALHFQVGDLADPIEVGSETVYEVRVTNTGSKTATNVQLLATLPAGMTPISGEGPTRVSVQGQQVVMEPLGRLSPQSEAEYKIRVRGEKSGDQRISVRLTSDELRTPVTKEESTRVYSDSE